MHIKSVLMASAVAALSMGGASQAFAENAPSTQASIRAQQAEIDYLKQQLKAMQDKLESLQTQTTTQAQAVATTQAQVAATVAKPVPHVTESATHKFALESADGLYSIGLTGRIHLDVGDYVGFTPKSREVGPQDLNSGFNARRARIGVTGKADGDFGYTFIYDAGGSADSSQGVIETAQLTYTGLKGAGYNTSFEFGYSDTFFTLGEAMSSNDILLMERAAPQIVATNINTGDNRSNIGGRYYDDRLWLGAYVTGPANGNAHGVGETVGSYQRAAYQFLSAPNYSLHLGVGLDEIIKAAGSGPGTANTVTLSSQPELRVDNTTFLTTGAIGTSSLVTGANHSVKGGYVADFEAAGGYGPFFAQGEYYHYSIDRIGLANASFDGEYVEAAYALTGESRKYNKASGAYGGIVPAYDFAPSQGHWGAFEIAARYSYIDLTSNFTAGLPISAASQPSAINGGKETGYTVGLNWYPNTYMRVMLNYVHTDFEKANPAAVTVAGVGTAAIGTPVGATIDAIALRTQVAW